MSLYLGIDVGTTKTAAVVVDVETGLPVASQGMPNANQLPAAPGRSEWDARAGLELAVTVAREAVEKARSAGQFAGIGVTGQMHGVVVVDEGPEPRTPLIGWQDKRCDEPVEGFSSTIAQMRQRGWIQVLGTVARVDPHPRVVLVAVEGLLRDGSRSARRAIHNGLVDGVHPANRAGAAWALGVMQAKRFASLLVRVATNRREAVNVRAEAAEALGYLRNRRAVEPLIGLLTDPAADVRANAAFALGNLGDARALRFLERLSADRTAAGTLGRICDVASDAAKSIRMLQPSSERPSRKKRRRPRTRR